MWQVLRQPVAWWLLLFMGVLPLAALVLKTLLDQWGANPAEALIRSTGDWTLRMLCAVLLVTPLRITLGWPELARFRRMLGLLTFAYACMHMLCYAWLDMGFEWLEIAKDFVKRPFILVGIIAFLIFLILAVTSFNRAIKWLGGRRWQMLHRSVYVSTILVVLHFWWMRSGKNNYAEVIAYAVIFMILLGWRIDYGWRRSNRINKFL